MESLKKNTAYFSLVLLKLRFTNISSTKNNSSVSWFLKKASTVGYLNCN